MTHARYIIVLDRYDDDDNCGRDGHTPRNDQEGMDQVAAELQEAMAQTGEPAGFFNVIARMEVDRNDEGANVSVLDPSFLRAKLLDTGFWVVGVTKSCTRLAICTTQEQAEEFVGTLPNHEDGRYYIDGPCFDPIQLTKE